MRTPFFSIIVTTHDRPNYLRSVLQMWKLQQFSDVEIIISDNSEEHDCKKVFSEIVGNDERFIYIRQNPQYSSGCGHFDNVFPDVTSGEYIAMVADVRCLHPFALKAIHKILCDEKFPPIISYNHIDANVNNENAKSIRVNIPDILPDCYNLKYDFYKPEEDLQCIFDFCRFGSGMIGPRADVVRGCGFCKRELIEEVKKMFGTSVVGFPFDECMKPALLFLTRGRECIHINEFLQIQFSHNLTSSGKSIRSKEALEKEVDVCEKLLKNSGGVLFCIPGVSFIECITYYHACFLQNILNKMRENHIVISDQYFINKTKLLAWIYKDVIMNGYNENENNMILANDMFEEICGALIEDEKNKYIHYINMLNEGKGMLTDEEDIIKSESISVANKKRQKKGFIKRIKLIMFGLYKRILKNNYIARQLKLGNWGILSREYNNITPIKYGKMLVRAEEAILASHNR